MARCSTSSSPASRWSLQPADEQRKRAAREPPFCLSISVDQAGLTGVTSPLLLSLFEMMSAAIPISAARPSNIGRVPIDFGAAVSTTGGGGGGAGSAIGGGGGGAVTGRTQPGGAACAAAAAAVVAADPPHTAECDCAPPRTANDTSGSIGEGVGAA